MTERISQDEINGILWQACDTFRGTIDATAVQGLHPRDAVHEVHVRPVEGQAERSTSSATSGDQDRVERAAWPRALRAARRSATSTPSTEAQRRANIGELINIALEKIEDANKAKLEGVFRNIDFNSEPNLGQTRGPQPPPEAPARGLRRPRARPAPVAYRQAGRDRQRLRVPDRPLRRRRGQEGRRVLHPGRSLASAGQAARRPAAATDLRPGLRLRLAADPSARSEVGVEQLLPLRPGDERLDLGAVPDEHVPARDGQRPHRVGQHHHQPELVEDDRADEVRRGGRESALLPRQVGRGGARPGRPLPPLPPRHPAEEQGRLRLHQPHDRDR